MSGKSRQSARDKLARIRAEQARHRRRRLWLAGAGAVVVVIGAAVAIAFAVSLGGSQTAGGGSTAGGSPRFDLAPLTALGKLAAPPPGGPLGPENVPIPDATPLASTASSALGQRVDGIGCLGSEQTLFHIHAHLTIFVNGMPRQVPAGIGTVLLGSNLVPVPTHHVPLSTVMKRSLGWKCGRLKLLPASHFTIWT